MALEEHLKDARQLTRDATPRPARPRAPAPRARSGAGGGGLSLGAAVVLTLGAAGAAWWTGDRLGYQRGLNQGPTACKDAELLDRLDAQARRHQDRLAARQGEPATPASTAAGAAPTGSPRVIQTPVGAVRRPEPDAFSFHDALRGAPGKTVERTPTLVSAAPMVRPPAMVVNIPPPTPNAVVVRPPAAAPAAAPAPTAETEGPPPGVAAAPATGELTLQTSAFTDKQDALKVLETLRARGYRPVIVPSQAGALTFYKVRVGRFGDRAAAEAGAQALQRATNTQPIILKH